MRFRRAGADAERGQFANHARSSRSEVSGEKRSAVTRSPVWGAIRNSRATARTTRSMQLPLRRSSINSRKPSRSSSRSGSSVSAEARRGGGRVQRRNRAQLIVRGAEVAGWSKTPAFSGSVRFAAWPAWIDFKHRNTLLSRKILLSADPEATLSSNGEVFDGSIGLRSGFDSNGENVRSSRDSPFLDAHEGSNWLGIARREQASGAGRQRTQRAFVGSEEARLHAGSVRRSNCTCRFPAYSFHKDGLGARVISQGRNQRDQVDQAKLAYSNCLYPVHRSAGNDATRYADDPLSSLWKSVRTWAREGVD